MKDLEGRVAVVTGSASGLGRAMAERFAHDGMTVVVADNRLAEAEAAAAEIRHGGGRATALEVDVTDRESVVALASRVEDELGGPDILVNNAGVVSFSPVIAAEEDGWRWIVDVNLFGVVYGLQAFLPRMLERGREGHVVNTASLAGVVGGNVDANRVRPGDGSPPLNGMYGYMATKHAVVAISEMLARDLSGTRIGVSVLCPSHHENTGIYENSARYRPGAVGGPMSDDEVQTAFGRIEQQRTETYGRPPTQLRFPDECAARVVRAIRDRQFYIFTHPETRGAIEQRFSAMLAGYDDAAAFTD